MTAEIVIGKSYPDGNLHGQRGGRIKIPLSPWVQFVSVKGERRIPMEFNPQTKEVRKWKFYDL